MAEMLLDATVFEDYRAGIPGARAIIEQIMDGTVTASVCPPTVFELWASPGFDRKSEIGYVGMLGFLEEATLSNEAAKAAGAWVAAVEEEDRGRLTPFALVAAVARERGEPICTSRSELFGEFCSEFVSY